MTRRPRDHEFPPDRWGWSDVMVIALGVVLFLVLTFELWIPHPAH